MSLVLLAPMEGLIDELMRELLTRSVAYDASVTPFIRVTDALQPRRAFYRMAPELKQGARTNSGTPVSVQLLGSDAEFMAQNADRLAGMQPAGVDLNFGCPAPLVNRHGGGAALLDEPETLHRITAQCAQAVAGRVPFSAKMRLGVKDPGRCVEAAQAIASGGIQQLVVHARTRDEFYRPPAHWHLLGRIAEAIKVPVVANGEIWTTADYERCRAESGCADVMIGRGAVADPFLVERIRAVQAGEAPRTLAQDWPRLTPLLGEFWRGVLVKVGPRHAPGRLKQWLNLLRRNYPEAERLHTHIRAMREAGEIEQAMQQAGVF